MKKLLLIIPLVLSLISYSAEGANTKHKTKPRHIQVSEVNGTFRYVVSTTNRNVSPPILIWFYHEQMNDWVSLEVSKVGNGWMSAGLPSDMALPAINSNVYIRK